MNKNLNLPDNELQIVVIDKPMYYLENEFVRDVLGKIIKLKVDSYDTTNSNYFAFDSSDLMATHFLAGRLKDGSFTPQIGIKCLSYLECEQRNVPFSINTIVNKSQSQPHLNAVEDFINQSFEHKEDIGYIGSLALDPGIKNKEKRISLLEIFESMVARYCFFQKTKNCICIGRIKTGAPKVIARIGYENLALKDQELSPLNCLDYANEQFYIMTLKDLSSEAIKLAHKYNQNWKNKIIFSDNVFDYAQFDNNIFDQTQRQRKAS